MLLFPTGLTTAMVFSQASLKRPSNNAAARMQLLELLLTKTEDLTLILKFLHWLPVSHRTDCTAACLSVIKWGRTKFPSDMFQQYTPARPLITGENSVENLLLELNMGKQLLAYMLLSSITNFLMTAKVNQL